MNSCLVFASLLATVCVVCQVKAQDETFVEIPTDYGYAAPVGGYGYPAEGYAGYPGGYPGGWGYPMGWNLDNSDVLTGGSAKANNNVLAGGSTSADNGQFTNTKTHSRTRGSSSVGFGMIGGDGGDNTNAVKNGIEYNGGGIGNFLSKVQGPNNQGIYNGNDLWKYLQGGMQGGVQGGYIPYPSAEAQ